MTGAAPCEALSRCSPRWRSHRGSPSLRAGSSSSSDTTSSATQGGEITISQTSQPDFLDPALAYTVNGWEPMWLVYTPLLTYRHADGTEGAELIPGLADGHAEDLRRRQDLQADAARRAQVLRRHARSRRPTSSTRSSGCSTSSPAARRFYEAIVGARQYVQAGDPEADITGIETDDKTGEITIKLTRPDAAFSNILAMNFAGLVPGDTPFKNMTEDPPPGVGPYEITESIPNREFVMEKSPNFASSTSRTSRRATSTRSRREIIKSPQQQAQDVLDNKLDYMQDPPPADLLPTVKEQAADRYAETTTASTYYMFMNTRDGAVRRPEGPRGRQLRRSTSRRWRACSAACSPRAARSCRPGMPGYDEAFDTTECPYGDPTQPPDLAKAKQLIKEAGADGTKVTVWGNNDDPTDKVTEALRRHAQQDRASTRRRRSSTAAVYFQTVGNQSTHAQTGFTNWFQDFPHPLNFYLPGRWRLDPADQQPELRQRRRPADQRRDRSR